MSELVATIYTNVSRLLLPLYAHQLGPSTLAGVALLFLFIPVQRWVVRRTRVLQKATMINSDERVKRVTEVRLKKR